MFMFSGARRNVSSSTECPESKDIRHHLVVVYYPARSVNRKFHLFACGVLQQKYANHNPTPAFNDGSVS